MNEFVLFAFLLFTANETNSFVRFLGESTARPNCFRFCLTFSISQKNRQMWTLDDCFTLSIDQGFGIYIHQEVCTVHRSAIGIFFISPILLQRTFFIVSFNFGPISNVRRYPCTTKVLSFFFLYCVKYFDILTS